MTGLSFRSERDLEQVTPRFLSVVRAGGVVVIPTETFYGLAADPGLDQAVVRICRMKGRPAEMGLPVLCATWGQVESLVEVPAVHRSRLKAAWPGPSESSKRSRHTYATGGRSSARTREG